MYSTQRKSGFTFADFFPIREGDLCQITDDANSKYLENMKYLLHDQSDRQITNHPLYNKMLLVLKIEGDMIHFFIQEDSEYSFMRRVDLRKVLL